MLPMPQSRRKGQRCLDLQPSEAILVCFFGFLRLVLHVYAFLSEVTALAELEGSSTHPYRVDLR